jgi:hypothetical protein
MAGHVGNSNATVRHGANSPRIVRKVATVQKRRLLRQVGLRQDDFDGIGLALLDNWARAQSKVELYDAWAAEHGYLTAAGESPPWVREYFAALNTSRLALRALQEHLKTQPKHNQLADIIHDMYGNGEAEGD